MFAWLYRIMIIITKHDQDRSQWVMRKGGWLITACPSFEFTGLFLFFSFLLLLLSAFRCGATKKKGQEIFRKYFIWFANEPGLAMINLFSFSFVQFLYFVVMKSSRTFNWLNSSLFWVEVEFWLYFCKMLYKFHVFSFCFLILHVNVRKWA